MSVSNKRDKKQLTFSKTIVNCQMELEMEVCKGIKVILRKNK